MSERKIMRLVKKYGNHVHGVGYYGDRDHADMKDCERKAAAAYKEIREAIRALASQQPAAQVVDDGFSTPDCPDCGCVQDGHCLCTPSKPPAGAAALRTAAQQEPRHD